MKPSPDWLASSGAHVAEVKFCGLTREADAAMAVQLGAAFAGVIFAGGPRRVTAERAAEIFHGLPSSVARVGVFAADEPDDVARVARIAGLDVVQLHGDPRAADVRALRQHFHGKVWAAARAHGSLLPEFAEELFLEADSVLLDAHVPGKLGGTGVTLEWSALAQTLGEMRGATAVVLAGGLTPGNVETAIRLLAPDVVDVSSGVESSAGIKDHDKMRAFVEAARRSGA